MTNAERIRKLSDKGLARMMFNLQLQTDVWKGIWIPEQWEEYLSKEYTRNETLEKIDKEERNRELLEWFAKNTKDERFREMLEEVGE